MSTPKDHVTVHRVIPGSFEIEEHFYTRVINATIHPMVATFLNLSNLQIARRYCHLNPQVDEKLLLKVLNDEPQHYAWAGSDLFMTTTDTGRRSMLVVETNSCPSGQKSMPFTDFDENNGYRRLIEETFVPLIRDYDGIEGGVLAVLYDKNHMEASGYAATIADVMDEEVFYVPMFRDETDHYKWDSEGVLHVRVSRPGEQDEEWVRVRAAFRYVTQKPWTRIPVVSKTLVLNPVLACLAGGRNKLVASKAYELYNADLQATESGLGIRTPETINDLHKAEIPLWIQRFGGHAAIKVPYSNAGQGVYTITNEGELDAFMENEDSYDLFIVQSLIGNSSWSSHTAKGRHYHVGTMPDRKNRSYVADLRMMVHYSRTKKRWSPLVIYGRRARVPLCASLNGSEDTWSMLGTNLSINTSNGWDTETSRLILMDKRDFNKLGVGIDDLIDGYIQAVLCALAIDRMASNLWNAEVDQGKFRVDLFRSLNNDDALLGEVGEGTALIRSEL